MKVEDRGWKIEDGGRRIEDGKIQSSFCGFGLRGESAIRIKRISSSAILDPPSSILDQSGVL